MENYGGFDDRKEYTKVTKVIDGIKREVILDPADDDFQKILDNYKKENWKIKSVQLQIRSKDGMIHVIDPAKNSRTYED